MIINLLEGSLSAVAILSINLLEGVIVNSSSLISMLE